MRFLRALLGFALIVVGSGALFLVATAPGVARIERAGVELALLQSEAGAIASHVRDFERTSSGNLLHPSMLLAGQTSAEAGLILQQDLVDLAAAHGVTLSSFGVSPSVEPSQPLISVVLEGKASLASFARFLAALEQRRPRAAVSQMILRSTSNYGPLDETGVVLRLTVWGFHSGSAG